MRRCLSIICVGLVSGCAHFEPKPLLPKQVADALQSRTLTDARLLSFIKTNAPKTAVSNWPPQSWDLRLLTLAALYYHPDIETARAKLASAEAAIITAGARPNPTFSFSPTYAEPPLEFFSPWTLGFSLDVPIETMGKRGYRIAQARHLANSARLDLNETAWKVRSKVRQALLGLYDANLTENILTQQQAVQDQSLHLLEQQLKAGEVTFLEAQVVRVAADETKLQLRDAEKQRGQARIQLADSLGVPVEATTNLNLSFSDFDQLPDVANAIKLRGEGLTNRADILGGLADYSASQAALQLEIAKQYPDVHFSPGYTWNEGVNNYSLGVSLTLPLLDRNQGPIAEANAHRREAAAAFMALQARAMTEIDAAYEAYADARRKLQTAESLLAEQQQRLKAMQKQFDAGGANKVDLLQTQSEIDLTLLAQASPRIEAQQALGLLEDAIRHPIAINDPPVELPSAKGKSN